MKVEIVIREDLDIPHAIIYTSEITEEVQRVLNYMRENTGTLLGSLDERMYVLHPKEIFLVRVEKDRTFIHTKDKTYQTGKRLYEVKKELGSDFVQISKSTIVKVSACESVENSFGGIMLLRLKNGMKEYVSRHYLPEFKKSIGL